ncbi:MAG: hypothetical protein ACREQ7_17450 [Candidatus Binatia bacterium]
MLSVSVTYRRHKSNPLFWHFCSNCSGWPTNDYDEIQDPESPPPGGFCTQCIALRGDHKYTGWAVSG